MDKPISILKEYTKDLLEICQKHQVNKLYAFGSIATEKFDIEKSDIDLIVELIEMSPIEKGEHLIELWDELEELFSRKVDLLTDQPIKNPYLKSNIEKSKVLIYDREREEVLI